MSELKLKNKVNENGNLSIISVRKLVILFIATLILVPTLIYFKSLNNEITNWDDNSYITENKDIRTLHGDSVTYTLNKTFLSYVMGNYHPLTMLGFCLEYNAFKLSAKPYHITSLILHLLNTLLVFYFIWLLSKQQWVAFITALLFAIHPMHVESVAWISELKDLLYTLFFMSAACTYCLFIKKEKWGFYFLTLLFFLLSTFSKGMAVSFSLLLFVIDYFNDRRFTVKVILEKIPFLLLSAVFGTIAILAQKHGKAIDTLNYNFFERLLFSFYGLLTYVWKLFLPVNLSCYYPYPVKKEGLYPLLLYISPAIILFLSFLVYKSKKIGKDVLFGFGFFITTIILVLQILPVGAAIIAERYTYVPYIGLFFIIAKGFNYLIESKSEKLKSFKTPTSILLILFILWCSYLTFQRTKVWHNTIALWTDVINKFKDDPLAYNNRAETYFWNGDYDRAITDFTKGITGGIETSSIFYKRGYSYFSAKRYNEAIIDFNRAISLSDASPIVYYKRGYAYYELNMLTEALKDYNYIIKVLPKAADAYYERGLVYYRMKKYKEAILDFNKAIALNVNYPSAYLSRGSSYVSIGKVQEAIDDFTLAIQYKPTYADAFYNRAITNLSVKNYEQALKDALKAKDLGHDIHPNLINDIQSRMNAESK